MVYEIGFVLDGKRYWFSGRKDVSKGPIWRLWRDTTTLYVKMHEGNDIAGDVVAAGVLRLSIFDLLSLILTVGTRDCVGIGERFGSIMTFVKFFASALWRTYVSGGSK